MNKSWKLRNKILIGYNESSHKKEGKKGLVSGETAYETTK